MPIGSRAPISMLLVSADERVGALDVVQRFDEAIDHLRAARAGDELQDALGVGGRLEDRAVLDQTLAQIARVGEVAVVRDGEAAEREVGEQRLHVAQDGAA